MRVLACAGVLAALMLSGCAAERAITAHEWTELGEGLRVDLGRRVVEFDGAVATDMHDPVTPIVWLELFVTGPDSREHESLVVTRVRPSLIHAALLGVGAEPGRPGRVWMDDSGAVVREPASGDALRVEFVVDDGSGDALVHDPAGWVVHETSKEPLTDHAEWGGFVFAGSRVVTRGGRSSYDADMTGVIVPLTSFGSGVISPRLTLSHASDLDEPVWIARGESVPRVGAPVSVRLTVLD